MASERTLNMAHRGARQVAPENTLPAFLRAMELGADGVELDVQLSRDGELVVIHDLTLDKTTSGTGPVAERTAAELRELDAGGWFGTEWAGTTIPTLREVFDALPHTAFVNVELKDFAVIGRGFEGVIADFIAAGRDLYERVIVSSFNPFLLNRLRRVDPRIRMGLIYSPDMPAGLRHGELAWWLRPEALHPYFEQVDSSFVAAAHASGREVNAWTVNEPEPMRRLLEWKVDVITTDVPDVLAGVLRDGNL